MTKIASSSRRVSVYTSRKYLFTCILAVLSLLGIGGGVRAQSYYVFYTGTYFNSDVTSSSTNFIPNASLYSGTSGSTFGNANGYYFGYNRNVSSRLVQVNSESDACNLTISGSYIYRIGGNNGNTEYYLYYYSGSWSLSSNNSTSCVYSVEVTPYVTPHTISGDATISSTGTNNSYAVATNLSHYTTYVFNNTTYYSTDPSVAASTSAISSTVTSGYTWRLSDNASAYATVNSSTGAITVNTRPTESDVVITLYCDYVLNGTTYTASMSVTITQDNRPVGNPTSIIATDVTVNTNSSITGNNYTVAISDDDYRPYDYVSATSANTSIATITNNSGSFTINGVAVGSTTVTIYAYGTDNTTVACSTTFTVTVIEPTTGVDGTVVTLNDYEDHNWSYYLPQLPSPDDAVDNPICSPYPRNVCIKYYGNGTGTVATTSDDEPTTFGADAEDVQVGIDAAANTFVYYKTLERYSTDIGRYEYTTIPNPFSVRPTYGSGDSRWRGFYKWRVKSITGGAIYTTADGSTTVEVGGTIDAEDVLYFQPTDNNYTNANNATSMTVELEALWAQAYVSVGTSGLSDYVTGTNAYERNFHVVSSSTASNFQKSYPCTVSGLYPNGTTDGGTTLATNVPSTYIYNNFTAAADTKFEYLTMYNYGNNDVYTANNHYLILGRGLSPYNNYGCATTIRGMSGESSDDLDYTIRVESGVYANYYQVYNGGNSQTDFDGLVTTRGVFGCDYDRAAEDNDNLEITAELYGGKVLRFTSSSNKSHLTFDYLVKSGNFQENVMTADINGEGGTQTFYLGSSQSASGNLQYIGLRRMTIEGGIMAGIAGGMNNASTTYTNSTDDVVVIRMKGGTISGSIYGAASFAWAVGIRKMIFTGGTVNGWIAGGCNGYTTGSGGTLTGDTKIYVGGTCQVVHTANDYKVGTSYGGNIFGAGSGYSADYEIGQVENSTIVIADECEVSRNVYGGGNYGYNNSGKTASVYVLGGQVDGAVFGGANQRYGQTTVVKMYDGWVKEGVYGGSNVEGTINNTTTVSVYGGTVGAEGDSANVHGGGLGSSTYVAQDVTVTIGEDCDNGPMIYGDVHGGSAQGTVNGTSSTSSATSYPTNVTVVGGTMNNVYGGGLGTNSIEANVWGPVTVSVTGGTINNVFGGNNVNGTPQSTISVTVNDACATEPTCSTETPTYTINGVFGGGNAANYDGTPTVTISDGAIKEVYGGGNAAEVESTTVSMTGGFVGTLYGGGKGASAVVNGTSTVNMTGGTAIGVFGGGNAGPIGTSSTDPNSTVISTVTVNNATVCTNVFGGGNAAVVKGSTQVNVIGSSTVGNNVYGGGNAGDVKGNTNVVIGDECISN